MQIIQLLETASVSISFRFMVRLLHVSIETLICGLSFYAVVRSPASEVHAQLALCTCGYEIQNKRISKLCFVSRESSPKFLWTSSVCIDMLRCLACIEFCEM
jgi:hypothetical protein